MIGITTAVSLICIASICAAFEFDLLNRNQPMSYKLFAPNDNDVLLAKILVDDINNESEDNAGFEKPQIFRGRSSSSTRKLIQEPPLKKREAGRRLIKEPPLKRSFAPIDLVYRFPYSVQKASRFGPVIRPIDF